MSFFRVVAPLLRVSSANVGQRAGYRPGFAPSDAKWRRERNLPACHTSFGPLTNLPDYTFADGRPTPLGSRQRKRVVQQREFAARIVQLSTELDHAKERLPRLQREAEQRRQELLSQKLKPKGHRLL